jgi:hypothetical protein
MLTIGLLVGAAAWAQDGGSSPDASIPDGSVVGIGGAEMNNEESDTGNGVCALSRDCERGFTCNQGKCTYTGLKLATCEGCGGGALGAMVPLALVWRRRRLKA